MVRKKSPYSSFSPKITKSAPFDLSRITEEFPYFSQILTIAIEQISELPDFSDDDKIAVMSDFGGEHQSAHFNTYSFLILAYNKIGPFIEKINQLRHKYNLLTPYSEFRFKDLSYGPRSRALSEFLHIVDNYIHGAIITIAIDKEIDTVFGNSKKETYPIIEESLETMEFGKWKGAVGEKALRICHSIALFISLTTRENQKLLWYCDNDAINENTRNRKFSDTQKIFIQALSMYSKHKFKLIGFSKSFNEKSYLDDLLSISDFTAGIVQDILTAHKTGNDNIPGGIEKITLLNWISAKSTFLTKITIQVSKLTNGEISSGVVNITPVKKST